MKKLLIISIVAMLLSAFLTGCTVQSFDVQVLATSDGPKMTVTVTNLGGGRMAQSFVIENVPYESVLGIATEALVNNPTYGLQLENKRKSRIHADGVSRAFDYRKTFAAGWPQASPTTYVLTILFENTGSFLYFNQITHIPQEIEIERGIFIVHRTIIMENPFVTFFEAIDNRTTDIVESLQMIFDIDSEDIDFIHIIQTRFRHNEVNSTRTTRNIDVYTHYFIATSQDDLGEIVIFDRLVGAYRDGNIYSTVPIWYGVGVLATLVFMGVIFVVSRQK